MSKSASGYDCAMFFKDALFGYKCSPQALQKVPLLTCLQAEHATATCGASLFIVLALEYSQVKNFI